MICWSLSATGATLSSGKIFMGKVAFVLPLTTVILSRAVSPTVQKDSTALHHAHSLFQTFKDDD